MTAIVNYSDTEDEVRQRKMKAKREDTEGEREDEGVGPNQLIELTQYINQKAGSLGFRPTILGNGDEGVGPN
jgi:hypothetical protein